MPMEEVKSIGFSSVLILLNVALMGVLAYTPVASLLSLAFEFAIVGILVYGAILTLGNYLAERGIKRADYGLAFLGVALLQFAYGSFGAGLLQQLSPRIQLAALGVTAVVTTGIAVLAAGLVYGTGRDFSRWQRYSNYLFLGVLGFGFIGTFFTPLLLLAFLSAILGFIVYLVYEIWDMKSSPSKTWLNGIGIYVAYMGVFIHILQLVIRMMQRE